MFVKIGTKAMMKLRIQIPTMREITTLRLRRTTIKKNRNESTRSSIVKESSCKKRDKMQE